METLLLTSDSKGATLVSSYKALDAFGMLNGTMILDNITNSDKTYYLYYAGSELYSGSVVDLESLGSSGFGENQIIAYPMNN